MKATPQGKKRFFKYAAIVTVVLFAAFVYEFRIIARVSFAVREWLNAKEWKARSLWLPDYRLVLAVTIDGIERNLSGLTWNGDTGTLFAITNRPPRVFELSTSGEMLRRIDLKGFDDTEAMEYIGNGRYIIVEERKQNIVLADIGAETSEIVRENLPRVTVGMGEDTNWGLEGLAWDSSREKLYAAKERFPIHIYEVSGFPQAPDTTLDIQVTGDRTWGDRLFVSDVAGLAFAPSHDHLLVLSEASKLLIEVDKSGEPISTMSLIAGHGLDGPLPQPEGIALDDEGTLYLASEPNLFYVFKKAR